MRAILWCVFLGACGLDRPALEVLPGETVRLDEGVNGDVACERGTLHLPAGSVINGWLDGDHCVLKIEGTVNGSITVHGGIVHVFDVRSVNGPLDVSGAFDVHIASSNFNGDGRVTGNRAVVVVGTSFNGELAIRNNGSCVAGNNSTNGGLLEASCVRP